MKVKLSVGEPADEETLQLLPERLRELINRSRQINDRVRRLDTNMYTPPQTSERPPMSNPVERQMGMLKAAFEQTAR